MLYGVGFSVPRSSKDQALLTNLPSRTASQGTRYCLGPLHCMHQLPQKILSSFHLKSSQPSYFDHFEKNRWSRVHAGCNCHQKVVECATDEYMTPILDGAEGPPQTLCVSSSSAIHEKPKHDELTPLSNECRMLIEARILQYVPL
ncbi:unnamed protein product, partial [Meganyctiphanes norvegica]